MPHAACAPTRLPASPVRRRPPARRAGALALVLALVTGGLAACGSDAPDPTVAATALAAGMAGGDLTAVVFDGASAADATTHRDTVLEPLADATRTVTLGDVVLAEDGATATATLDYAWVIGGTPWSYTTTAPMALVEDTWHVVWSPGLLIPDLAMGERLQTSRTSAPRADILGDSDVVLVTQRPVKRVGIDKTRIAAAEWDGAARALAALTGIDSEAYAAKVASAGEKAFVEAVTLRTEGDYDWPAIGESPGVLLVDASLPLAPTRQFASEILGRAGDATAEIIEASEGAIQAGDLVGLSGVQRQYDAQLRGTPGLVVEIVGADGTARDAFRVDPVPGEPLRLTLDPTVQSLAEKTIADQIVPAAIVAIRPSTGAVIASANSPASDGLSTATTGMYAPGSTFKVVTALALLRGGSTPETMMECSADTVVDGRTFTNYPDYPANRMGQIALRDVIANSCNTAIINAAGQVSQADLVSAGQSLGLGLAPQAGPGVFTGSVPGDASGTEHAASMIGQGKVQASPLAMAGVAASVASGTTVRPTFLAQEAEAPTSDLPVAPGTALTTEEAAALSSMMRSVVTDGGGAFLQGVPGGDVSAKTGTAQYGDGSTNHAWVIAIQGDLAVAVFVETGDYGSTTAGPLLKAFLTGLA
ncbi:penicillin-binding transpeptidase domain-containing protein [Sanguibacter gelidistatuariae]|nr:penicillin-binding transpeptidase domain-containing protein [Sanguibacter gelidistatuariae]